MELLQCMRTFVRVVECGTFSAAAIQMDCSAATVSRAVSELETKLRIRLLNRTTRAIALTAVGQRYLDRCKDALAIIDDAAAEATRSNGRPSGCLRIHALPSLGQHYVIPAIASFRSQYPEVRVDLTVTSQMPHLLEEGYDVAMILSPGLPDSVFVSRLLGVTYSVLCASPTYLAKRGRPITLSDLQQHDCLQLAIPSAYASTDTWTLEGPDGKISVPVNGPLRVNSPELMSAAVRDDMGIGAIPVYAMTQSLRDGSVERVLPDHRLLDLQIHALYSSRRYLDAKTGAWLDFVQQDLPLRMSADMDLLACQSPRYKSA